MFDQSNTALIEAHAIGRALMGSSCWVIIRGSAAHSTVDVSAQTHGAHPSGHHPLPPTAHASFPPVLRPGRRRPGSGFWTVCSPSVLCRYAVLLEDRCFSSSQAPPVRRQSSIFIAHQSPVHHHRGALQGTSSIATFLLCIAKVSVSCLPIAHSHGLSN